MILHNMIRHHLKLAALSLVTCLIAGLAFTLAASAATETMLHTFVQKPNGAYSQAGLIADDRNRGFGQHAAAGVGDGAGDAAQSLLGESAGREFRRHPS